MVEITRSGEVESYHHGVAASFKWID